MSFIEDFKERYYARKIQKTLMKYYQMKMNNDMAEFEIKASSVLVTKDALTRPYEIKLRNYIMVYKVIDVGTMGNHMSMNCMCQVTHMNELTLRKAYDENVQRFLLTIIDVVDEELAEMLGFVLNPEYIQIQKNIKKWRDKL